MGRLTRRNFRFDESDYMVSVTAEALNKLAHYEDLEEQGRLIELPCAVGETVYVIEEGYKDIDLPSTSYYYIEENPYDLYMLYAKGDWVFFTKEEAEAKLKEMEEAK